jgi:hypothetical protein
LQIKTTVNIDLTKFVEDGLQYFLLTAPHFALSPASRTIPTTVLYLLLDLRLVEVHHDHEGDKVEEHGGEQPVLFVLQPLLLALTQTPLHKIII